MSQTQIPFVEKLDIPKKHLDAFIVCNSANNWSEKQSFYIFKNELLKKYGHENGYDLQIIEKECWTCNGTGKYKCNWKPIENCWSCWGAGIYHTKQIILKRWLLNGCLFHQPVDDIDKPFTNTIKGLIKHEEPSSNPLWSYYYLLWNYDKNKLYKEIEYLLKSLKLAKKNKLKMLLRKHNPMIAIADFFKISNKELDDELPF